MAGRGPGIAVPPGAAGGIQPNDIPFSILVRIPHGSIPGLVLVRIPFWVGGGVNRDTNQSLFIEANFLTNTS